jgi:hypothetical protein
MPSRTTRVRRGAIAVAAAVAGLASLTPAAHAGWTNLGTTWWSNGTTYFLGCKTYESGGYGPVYRTTIVGVNQTTTGKRMRMQVRRHGSQLVSSGSVWVPADSYRPLTLYTSIIFNDTVNAQLYNAAGDHASTGPLNPARFGNC